MPKNILGGGDFYRPFASVQQRLREAFRDKILSEHEKKVRIDAAFLALRGLSSVLHEANLILPTSTSPEPEEQNMFSCKSTVRVAKWTQMIGPIS